MFKLNIITVNYETSDFVNNLIFLIKNEEDVSVNFIVVDNSGGLVINDPRETKSLKLKIKKNNERYDNVLDSHRGGLDAALEEVKEDYEFTLFMDPDIVFTKGALKKSLAHMLRGGLDCFGVGKFYQWHKRLPDIKIPYVWFTFIKTDHLKNFNFKIGFIDRAKRALRIKNAVKDTGDKIYNLIEKKKLKHDLLDKYPKNNQGSEYIFKFFNTDDWKNEKLEVIVSHYRAGSRERNFKTHGKNYKEKQKEFLKKAKKFEIN